MVTLKVGDLVVAEVWVIDPLIVVSGVNVSVVDPMLWASGVTAVLTEVQNVPPRVICNVGDLVVACVMRVAELVFVALGVTVDVSDLVDTRGVDSVEPLLVTSLGNVDVEYDTGALGVTLDVRDPNNVVPRIPFEVDNTVFADEVVEPIAPGVTADVGSVTAPAVILGPMEAQGVALEDK